MISAGQLLDQEVLPVAVRVADEDLGRAGVAGTLDRGEDLGGHELAEAGVLEAGGSELRWRDGAGHALHVGGNVDLEGLLTQSTGRDGKR